MGNSHQWEIKRLNKHMKMFIHAPKQRSENGIFTSQMVEKSHSPHPPFPLERPQADSRISNMEIYLW